MKRYRDIQKAVSAAGGRVDGCPPCPRCGCEMLADRPADYDPLKPEYKDWHEGYDCYEVDHLDETWSVHLMRCPKCSGLYTHIEKRKIN